MKRNLLIVLIFAVALLGAHADSSQTGLFTAADKVGTDMPRTLSGDGELLLGGIFYNGIPVSLGDLFADLLANRLTGRNDFNVDVVKAFQNLAYPPGRASWILSGNLYSSGSGYILTLELLDNSNSTQIKGWDFPLTGADAENLLTPSLLAAAMDWDIYEPNDSYEAAALVELPFQTDGLMLSSGDEDWFAFEAPAPSGDSVYILYAATSGDTDTYLELYSPDDTSWPVAEDDDTDGSNGVIQMPLDLPGIWYLKVRAYDGETSGEYGLTLTLDEGALGPGEPDNGPEDAHALNVGQPPIGFQIDYTGDRDWFRIVLSRPLGSNEVLRIETLGDYDTILVLLDEYEGEIMSDDDSGFESNAMIQAGGLQAGTYYATVSGYGGEVFPYSIMANITVPVRDEYEDDPSISMHSEISLGERQERNFSPIGDIDWVKFTLTGNGRYIIRTEGSIDTYMELYNSYGELLTENDDFDDQNAAIEYLFEAGDYFVQVSPYGSASPDDVYTLVLERE